MDGEEVVLICRDCIVVPQKFILYSELLEVYSSNDVLLIVGCTGGTDVSVVCEECEVEVDGLFGDGVTVRVMHQLIADSDWNSSSFQRADSFVFVHSIVVISELARCACDFSSTAAS